MLAECCYLSDNCDGPTPVFQLTNQATETRMAIVDQANAENMNIGGYHFGVPNAGKIGKDDDSHVCVPATV